MSTHDPSHTPKSAQEMFQSVAMLAHTCKLAAEHASSVANDLRAIVASSLDKEEPVGQHGAIPVAEPRPDTTALDGVCEWYWCVECTGGGLNGWVAPGGGFTMKLTARSRFESEELASIKVAALRPMFPNTTFRVVTVRATVSIEKSIGNDQELIDVWLTCDPADRRDIVYMLRRMDPHTVDGAMDARLRLANALEHLIP